METAKYSNWVKTASKKKTFKKKAKISQRFFD